MTADIHDIDAQEAQASKAAEAAALAEAQSVEDLRLLMAVPWGRRIMARVLNSAAVDGLSFSRDALAMAFNEGQRMEGIKWLALVKRHTFTDYLKMIKEANNG
jgi:hypothetical protein